MGEENTVLEATGLRKVFRDFWGRPRTVAVDGVSLRAAPGEIVGLLGPNGAGKTTSFYMVTGLIKPNEGEVFFKGVDVSHFPMYVRARMGMGYLAQEPSIFRKLSVEDNIMLPIVMSKKKNTAEYRKKLDEILAITGLTEKRKYKPGQLRGLFPAAPGF